MAEKQWRVCTYCGKDVAEGRYCPQCGEDVHGIITQKQAERAEELKKYHHHKAAASDASRRQQMLHMEILAINRARKDIRKKWERNEHGYKVGLAPKEWV